MKSLHKRSKLSHVLTEGKVGRFTNVMLHKGLILVMILVYGTAIEFYSNLQYIPYLKQIVLLNIETSVEYFLKHIKIVTEKD